MTDLRKHQEQFERMKRWYERIKKIDQGRQHDLSFINLSPGYFHDEVYAFFQNCYHLKDWIKNDETVRLPEKDVEDFINQNECMCLCADICNGTKHLKLKDERRRSDQYPDFGGRKFSLSLEGGPEPIIGVKFSIETKKGTIDTFELASECVRKWEEFIKDNIK
jgi:hypothetical protein